MQIDQDENQIHVKEKPTTYLTSCQGCIFTPPPHYLHFKLEKELLTSTYTYHVYVCSQIQYFQPTLV